MEFSFLTAPFSTRCFFAPLHSLADHDAVVTLHLPGWRLLGRVYPELYVDILRFAYHPHLNPLPSRERKFWLAIMDASLVTNEFCIPLEEKEYD